MFIGDGMAFTSLKLLNGINIGTFLYDEEGAKIVQGIMDSAKVKGVEIVLPVDFVCSSKLGKSKTIIWNDPVGIFEIVSFERGAKAIMDKIVEVTQSGTTIVIGGGDTATACKK